MPITDGRSISSHSNCNGVSLPINGMALICILFLIADGRRWDISTIINGVERTKEGIF